MNKKGLIVGVIIIVLVIIGVWIVVSTKNTPQNTQSTISMDIDPAAEQAEVISTVKSFGYKLKDVSLLAPAATVGQSMDNEYAAFVTPQLLAKWKSNPSSAPGRTVSSPSPDRIDVLNATKNTDATYTVTGNIVEVSSTGAAPTASSSYPVKFTLTKVNDFWFISSYERNP
jgi:hypothetical protein